MGVSKETEMPATAKDRQISVCIASDTDAWLERRAGSEGSRDSLRAFTGTIPDYTTEVEGLRLSDVIEGGPAEQGGLEGGDVIIEFAGQAITNIYDYTYALEAVKIDVPVKVVFLRDGEQREVTITPTARK